MPHTADRHGRSFDNPSFDCLAGGHLSADIHDTATGQNIGGWCMWCGTAAYDGDRIDDDGRPVGFTPAVSVRVPDHFHRATI